MATEKTVHQPRHKPDILDRLHIAAVGHWIAKVLRKAGFLLMALMGIYLMLMLLLHPWYSNWGASATEQDMTLPGDELIPNPGTQITRGVTIDAPPEAVWPWLLQMGVDRAGLYTYTWFENGVLRLNVTNADEIVPAWQDLKVGDIIAYTPEDYPTGRTGPLVIAMEPNRALIMCGSHTEENCPRTWQLVLRAQQDGTTRLLARWRNSADVSTIGTVLESQMDIGYFVMERKMLLGIKERAENNNYSVSIEPLDSQFATQRAH